MTEVKRPPQSHLACKSAAFEGHLHFSDTASRTAPRAAHEGPGSGDHRSRAIHRGNLSRCQPIVRTTKRRWSDLWNSRPYGAPSPTLASSGRCKRQSVERVLGGLCTALTKRVSNSCPRLTRHYTRPQHYDNSIYASFTSRRARRHVF